ncbi:LysE/ArgO family amino acid transporter [Geomonas sp. RF6]|uniref:LysE/ArgO family amino acid transporter n=1 Tax=Geomonas sp. RF6 TaxID=2897342 RepID=UPI001E314C11|nr:LysE/ArgO family amino acid transporter [Geomonas sp. RF6]UFS70339.1 LysE/ArgO family amino acid transporter [Geomonas sp. RF6]
MISAYPLALSPTVTGFGLGASLIVAIGSQNAFVLRQGLKNQHVFTVSTISFLCDALLISLGAGGFSSVVATSPLLMTVTLWGGVLFLSAYGLRSFAAAARPGMLEAIPDAKGPAQFAEVLVTTVSLSLLNPHAFLDTVILLGSVAGQYAGQSRLLFAAGAISASFAWFYTLGYGARMLAPLFRNPLAWRLLDIVVGCTMWGIAIKLACSI